MKCWNPNFTEGTTTFFFSPLCRLLIQNCASFMFSIQNGVLTEKNAVLPHQGYPTVQYWSLWEDWRESRDSGDHMIERFWSVITQVMTPRRARCVFTWLRCRCVCARASGDSTKEDDSRFLYWWAEVWVLIQIILKCCSFKVSAVTWKERFWGERIWKQWQKIEEENLY